MKEESVLEIVVKAWLRTAERETLSIPVQQRCRSLYSE